MFLQETAEQLFVRLFPDAPVHYSFGKRLNTQELRPRAPPAEHVEYHLPSRESIQEYHALLAKHAQEAEEAARKPEPSSRPRSDTRPFGTRLTHKLNSVEYHRPSRKSIQEYNALPAEHGPIRESTSASSARPLNRPVRND